MTALLSCTHPSDQPGACEAPAIMQLQACGLALRAAIINALAAYSELAGARGARAEELVSLIGDAIAFSRRLEMVVEGGWRAQQ